jgi:hypothetical protein
MTCDPCYIDFYYYDKQMQFDIEIEEKCEEYLAEAYRIIKRKLGISLYLQLCEEFEDFLESPQEYIDLCDFEPYHIYALTQDYKQLAEYELAVHEARWESSLDDF